MSSTTRPISSRRAIPHRRLLCQLIGAALAAGSLAAHAGAPPAFSQAWFAQRAGQTATAAPSTPTGTSGLAGGVATAPNLLTQQGVKQSIANLNTAVQAVAAQMSAQRAAQQAVAPDITVPNGLAVGGLQAASASGPVAGTWQNAQGPTQSVSSTGQTNVEIKQTAAKAILTWDTFNVGSATTVHFDQTSGKQNDGSNTWIALNRVVDPSLSPSRILGKINAEGTVYLINRNGVLFGAGSQVNTHSLLVTTMDLFSADTSRSNAFFLGYGIASLTDPNHILSSQDTVSAFLINGANPGGGNAAPPAITVEKGASLTTQPQGFTLLAAPAIRQAGSIMADDGAAILASAPTLAYDATNGFVGVKSAGGSLDPNWPGDIENSGLIQARRGSIEWVGTGMNQDGVLVASTSLSHPGTIRLIGSNVGTTPAAISLGAGSVTTVLPEKDGETTSSSPVADASFKTSTVSVSGNSVRMDPGALIEAPSGNVTMAAADTVVGGARVPGRVYIDSGATIDVSGLADVQLPMGALLVTIPRIGQNELADSPLLRNGFLYTQKNVAIDSAQSGTRADGVDWVGSPILNAAGYVQAVPRTIDQLMIKAGSIALAAGETITRSGSQLRADGGYISYLPGVIRTPNLLGADGLVYNIASADPNVQYVGFAGQYTADHARWGVSEVYDTPLISGSARFDPGFIQGGDAGSLTIGGANLAGIAMLDGDLSAHAYSGRNQVAQGNHALGGSIAIISAVSGLDVDYKIVADTQPLEIARPTFDAQSSLGEAPDGGAPPAPAPDLYLLSAARIDGGGFRKFQLTTTGGITVDPSANLEVVPGGDIELSATSINVAGTLKATAGTIGLTATNQSERADDHIEVGATGRLDARGLWVNDFARAADDLGGAQFVNGGSINLTTELRGAGGADTTPSINLAAGSVLDASGGGYLQQDGTLERVQGRPVGRGGNISLVTHGATTQLGRDTTYDRPPTSVTGGAVHLDGTLLGFGFEGGGTLAIEAPQIQIGGAPSGSSATALLYLPASFFSQQGFARYALTAETDATVAPGVTVNVQPLNLIANEDALSQAATGADIYGAGLTTVGRLDPFQRWQAGQGQDAGLSLVAGNYRGWNTSHTVPSVEYPGVTGSVVIGKGATVNVDPGATIAVTAADRVEVLGVLRAQGGSIAISSREAPGFDNSFTAPDRAVWLADGSMLDASGISLIDQLAAPAAGAQGPFVPRTGVVLAGGVVTLNADQALVASSGAMIDVSGASDTYQLPSDAASSGLRANGVAATPVWSDAGSISLAAGSELFFDATLAAHAGSPHAEGGSLTVAGVVPTSTAQPEAQAIVLQQGGTLVPAGYVGGDAIPGDSANVGMLAFAVDRLDGSGITSFSVGPVPGDVSTRVLPLLFAGDVNLRLARSIVINASSLAALPQAGALTVPVDGSTVAGAGTVQLDAPYVDLVNGNVTALPGTVFGDGKLSVHAGFLDMGGQMSLQGFASAAFASDGDVRFTAPANLSYANGTPVTGWLYSTGDLAFSASRIYPATDYHMLIDADASGVDANGVARETTVSFAGNGHADTSTPYSAGGMLAVAATHIDQDGNLRVPSGSIMLGADDPAASRQALALDATFPLVASQSVTLGGSSTTSVSLGGQVLPYGESIDGKEWRYDGDPAIPAADITSAPAKQITLAGDHVTLQQGATVDLSGGGDLQAFEWVPGTGGSRDVLSQYQTSYAGSTAGAQVPQYVDGRAIYAIVPGYTAPVAAHDAALEKGAGAMPALGQAVYLSDVSGLADGVYTLLPARYATLPGAYRVVQNAGAQDTVPGRSAIAPDGTQTVAGYFTDAITGARSSRSTSFQVQSAEVWQQYSQYDLTQASAFFPTLAAHAGDVAPPSPVDAGRLVLEANQQLTLGTTLDANVADGGRGAQVDIAGQAIEIASLGTPARDGYLMIDPLTLSALGASDLLIGGIRSVTPDGDHVAVSAHDLVIATDAAHPLQAPVITLVTDGQGGGLTFTDGSVINAVGAAGSNMPTRLLFGQMPGDPSGAPAVAGDGALLRVSTGGAATITRSYVTGADGVAGTAHGDLTLGQGVRVSGNALSIDGTGNAHVDDTATLRASNVDITASRIGFAQGDAPPELPGLLIGPATLAQFAVANSVILRSGSTIDFYGNVDLAVDHTLDLGAKALTSDGGNVDIQAGTLVLGNAPGSAAGTFVRGSGSLQVRAGELDFGNGTSTLQGFGSVNANLASGVAARGIGSFDFGNLDVTIKTPVLLADTSSHVDVRTTGALVMAGNAGTALSRSAIGGLIDLSGGSLDIATSIIAPAGHVALEATSGDLTVDNGAYLGVAGVASSIFDAQVHTPGGVLSLDAAQGAVNMASGATLDVSGDGVASNGGKIILNSALTPTLQGQFVGKVTPGYLGGSLDLDTAGGVDLNALAPSLTRGGMTGLLSIQTGQGNLALAAGNTLKAYGVDLTANSAQAGEGIVGIDGSIDASGASGGAIALYGRGGVDVEGRLLANATAAAHAGGSITLGTSGSSDGTLNTSLGYENVQAADSGSIRVGDTAYLALGGDGGNGQLKIRAPLLASGDVNVVIAPGARIDHANAVTLEAYATWSTADAPAQSWQHFDGLVDPAGWYTADPATGVPTLVAGHFTDASGQDVADPDRSNPTQMADYLARYYFTPDATNTDHQGFYGFINGDPGQGAGAVMGFIQTPGVTFASRFEGVPGFHIRPGVELVNPDVAVNHGDVSILTTWNLGAGSRDADNALHLDYRFGDQAPIINFRALHDLKLQASVVDGFFQDGNIVQAPSPEAEYIDASAAWDVLQDRSIGDIGNADYFSAPTEFASGDPVAIRQYYGQYVAYATYLTTGTGDLANAGFSPLDVIAYGLSGLVGPPVSTPGAPPPPPVSPMLNGYPAYLSAYESYLLKSIGASEFLDTFVVPDTFVTLAAPPETLDRLTPPPPVVDNSPSPLRLPGDPLPLLSATLTGGASSSYRFVAGADVSSADPLAVQTSPGASGNVTLDSHSDYIDADSGRTMYQPTLVRTGTGNIQVAAAGDIRWLDEIAPAAIYSAGTPAPGTTAANGVAIQSLPSGEKIVVSGPVNPIDGGDVSLLARGDIVGLQPLADVDGSVTGTVGTSLTQYWWPWMQMGNSAQRSSINFSGFAQGVMSVGGNVDVSAGGSVEQLSVSLPTTWYVSTGTDGQPTLNTVGGGNLRVDAGADILGGNYFVAHGSGLLQSGGRFGAPTGTDGLAPLLGLQDAQVSVQSTGTLTIGGIVNPSWLDLLDNQVDQALPVGHFDDQSYSSTSAVTAISLGGDVDLESSAQATSVLFAGGDSSGPGRPSQATLPASIAFGAPNGDIHIDASGELYPSATGNLTLLAGNSIKFDKLGQDGDLQAFGLIDAPASLLPSPLNPGGSSVSLFNASYILGSDAPTRAGLLHQADALHGADSSAVQIYALNGDIIDGNGGGLDSLFIVPSKAASIQAGRDIVDLAFLGQHTHDADLTRIVAGQDIYDTSPSLAANLGSAGGQETVLPTILQAGPGTLVVQAGRDIGPLANLADFYALPPNIQSLYKPILLNGSPQVGIESLGNALNPYLPYQGSSINVTYGIAPGVDQSAFITRYVDPTASVAGVPSLTPDLVSFMQDYDAGQAVDTGYAIDKMTVTLTADQAWQQFQALAPQVQALFVGKSLFKILAAVGADYGNPASPYAGQYSRGYAALNTLFPATLGYTDNGAGNGGLNGASATVDTGNLDIRGTTIQTQQGGDVGILAPGGEALLGSTSAPPVISDANGNVLAGPNTMGVLTLRQGNVGMFTDRSVLLAQSRIFTEQGGDIVAWSSNGDINAGKGAKTTTEIPPVSYLCDLNGWCRLNVAGEVSGAGIATLQSTPGALTGNAYLMAPRGTVDAGDAGIRVSGNLFIAAARVANADNIQVQGEKVGIPVTATVNIGALNAANSAAGAAAKVAEDVARKQQADSRDRMPSVISVQVLGSGDNHTSVEPRANNPQYDAGGPVQVLGNGRLSEARLNALTPAERSRLSE
jgi:filamentous hemagglutinin family protein